RGAGLGRRAAAVPAAGNRRRRPVAGARPRRCTAGIARVGAGGGHRPFAPAADRTARWPPVGQSGQCRTQTFQIAGECRVAASRAEPCARRADRAGGLGAALSPAPRAAVMLRLPDRCESNVSDTPRQPLSRLQRLWLCESIRLREEQAGLLEDAEANRHARALGGDLPTLIERRALALGERDGLLLAQRHWLQGAQLATLLLALLALLAGGALALTALGDGSRPVNVFWALGSLLGLHLLSLLGWLAGLVLLRDSGGALGRLWLWLCARLARDARSLALAPALLQLLQRQRLARWGLGALLHGLWALLLAAALALLLAMLATRDYRFLWETTLLGERAFIGLTHLLGSVPAWLGFSLPASEQIAASGGVAPAESVIRQAWAGWLIGVVLVWG